MKQKNLLILATLTVVIVILALIIGTLRDADVASDTTPQRLYQDLFAKINNISSVEVRQGSTTITLMKKDNNWHVQEKQGYYANLSKIKAAIVSIADFTSVEAKTAKPELYSKLGVSDATSADAHNTQVTLKDGNGTELAAVILGNRRPGSKPQQYVRKVGTEQSWLVNGYVAADTQINNWLDKSIVDVKRGTIRSIIINHKNALQISRDQASVTDFSVANLPKNKKLKSQSAVNALAAVLENLSFDDVLGSTDFDMAAAKPVSADFSTFDGQTLHTEVAEQNGKWYLRLTAEFQPPAPEASPASTQITMSPEAATPEVPVAANSTPSPPPPPPVETPRRTPDQVTAEVARINDRTTHWIYVLPKPKAENFVKSLNDLIE